MRHIKRVAVLTAISAFISLMPIISVKAAEKPKAEIYTVTVTDSASQLHAGTQTVLISSGTFTVTAYSPDPRDSGSWGSQTKAGITAVEGITVAADWRVLPEGTKVYADGHYYTVQDVGGKIRGRHIDVYFSSHEQAVEFGRKKLEIYVLKG